MDIARHWRLKKQRYSLERDGAQQGVLAIAGAGMNGHKPHSLAEAQKTATQAITGTVYSFTKVFDAPSGYAEAAPYLIGLVELDDGSRLTAQLTDIGPEGVQIGMPVEMVTRKLRSTSDERGMLVYGYKFRPLVQPVS